MQQQHSLPPTLTPTRARAEIRAALEEAIALAEKDAARLGGATYGRVLAGLARKWRGTLDRGVAAGA
jgi:hypothetical protein